MSGTVMRYQLPHWVAPCSTFRGGLKHNTQEYEGRDNLAVEDRHLRQKMVSENIEVIYTLQISWRGWRGIIEARVMWVQQIQIMTFVIMVMPIEI